MEHANSEDQMEILSGRLQKLEADVADLGDIATGAAVIAVGMLLWKLGKGVSRACRKSSV